eukprot:gnl/Chilomastix_cuspidata/2930.p1 GENE.gnl/Chilomastix_cuspidata/2930~~gnl/Chilomastix_cuspidata/2930.p1  ORF type:complete len:264 (+),score=92.15 gnl/Chilomastix_cuspidata/2930:602-1393(+)
MRVWATALAIMYPKHCECANKSVQSLLAPRCGAVAQSSRATQGGVGRCAIFGDSTSASRPSAMKISLGVVFDLEGTLTLPQLDYRKIRTQIGCKKGQNIQVFLEAQPEPERAEKERILEQWMKAAQMIELRPGCIQTLRKLRKMRVEIGILTASMPYNVALLARRLPNDVSFSITRTSADPPPKPDPRALAPFLEGWNLDAREVLLVGDSMRDLQTALNAGVDFVLVRRPGNGTLAAHAATAVDTLPELIPIVEAKIAALSTR